MTQTPDIHDQEQRLKWNQKKFSNSEHVCDPNKELVKQFCDKCFAEGLSDARVKKYITNFHTIFKLSEGIDFVLDEADRKTLEKVVARIERSDYAEATKSDFKACLKKYYKVMEGEGFQYPDKVKFFSQTRDSSKIEKPDPLSKEQIMRTLDETQNDRDLALYHLLYEGALRPQEILSLSISDLSWTSQGVRVNVNGKTGNRQILVVECKDHLRRWMERHPLADQRNAPLWTDLNVDSDKKMEQLRMNYDYFRIKLKRLSKKADVRTYRENGKTRTEVYPYLYRHTRLTELARELSESSLKAYAGWTQGSDMAEVYVHLSGRDIDDQILSIYGLDKEDQGISTCCNKCDREVGETASYCPRCGSPV